MTRFRKNEEVRQSQIFADAIKTMVFVRSYGKQSVSEFCQRHGIKNNDSQFRKMNAAAITEEEKALFLKALGFENETALLQESASYGNFTCSYKINNCFSVPHVRARVAESIMEKMITDGARKYAKDLLGVSSEEAMMNRLRNSMTQEQAINILVVCGEANPEKIIQTKFIEMLRKMGEKLAQTPRINTDITGIH